MQKTKIFCCAAILILSSCSTMRSKDTYSPSVYTEAGCDRILTELDYARRYKMSIHKNDKFMYRYLLVIPAIFETVNIIRNEHKVNKRIEELKASAQRSGCYNNNADASSEFVPYTQSAEVTRQATTQNQSSYKSSGSSSSFLSGLANLFK